MLRQARTAQGLSIAEVSERLNLSVRQVMALEAEDFAHLPQPPYVRGYLRSYAALVGLSPPTVVAAYDGQIRERAELPVLHPVGAPPADIEFEKRDAPAASGSMGVLGVAAAVVFALVAGGGYWLWRGVSRHSAGPATGATVAGAVGPAHAGRQAPAPNFSASVTLPPNVPAPAAVPPPVTPAPSAAGPAVPPPQTVPRAPASAPRLPGQGAYGQLVVVPGQATLVKVQDQAGNTLLQERVPAGQPLSLDGLSPFTVTLSNPRGASVRYNGHPVVVPAPGGGPVRLIVGGSAP